MKVSVCWIAGLIAATATLCLASRPARAEAPPRKATFALIVGSNASVDADLPRLKYADDDAARYLDLFRLLGARTTLLTRVDDDTRRLHPQAAAEAQEPRRAVLERGIEQLAADVAQARDRGVETVAYIVYAGHGNVKDGVGYITLEDARITGADLAQLIAKIPATSVHVIVDACASYFLAYSRGPGGERRSLRGFQDAAELAALPRVGLLLSTSSARESHEWDAFESGVFSHEVRSGLYGAADADGDGTVSYREIAAFVARANAAVPNERFRPDVYVRPPPAGSETLVDLRRGLARRLDVDGAHAAHYYLEDTRGVRIADFHNAVGQSVHLVKPAPNGAVYLRRVDDDREFDVPAAPDVVSIAELSSAAPRVASRGAAHDAFNTLFTLPFGRAVVEAYRAAPPPSAPPAPSRETTAPSTASATRRRIGWSLAAGGAATVGVGAAFAVIAKAAHDGGSATEPQLDTELRNERIRTSNVIATAAFGVGVAAVTTGAVLILWPRARGVTASIAPSAAVVGYGGSF